MSGEGEISIESTSPPQKLHILESLGIPENKSGKTIGTLILCGQGPVQDSATKIKLESLNNAMPGSVSGHEANTWMRLIARAAGELNSEGDVGLIITSGKDTGGSYTKDGEELKPTEAELMGKIISNLSGEETQIELEKEAKNTLFNIINAANIIDDKKSLNPNDPNLENVWIMGSHFHGPRLKILASLFGFDPGHVLSAEKVLNISSQIREERRGIKIEKFDRQKSFQKLIKARLSGEEISQEGQNYFQRKEKRAEILLDRLIEKRLRENGVSEDKISEQKEEMKKKFFIEEQKSAQTRMNDERRWVRGLAMEVDYVLPYSVYLKNDARLRSFLLKFGQKTLERYNIQREELETITSENEAEIMRKVRTRIDPNRWSWQVVKEGWKSQEYPSEVKARFASLGIPEEDIESLSQAEVPSLNSPESKEKEKATTISFLRHAPTQWSRDHKVQGNVQTELIPDEILPYFERMNVKSILKPDLIVVSKLKRTAQTAEALKSYLGWEETQIVEDSAFNERSWGIFEGKTHEEVKSILLQDSNLLEKYPYLKTGEFERIWSDPDFKVEGSESLSELAIRVNAGMIELNKKYPGRNILLITHAGVLQTQGMDFNSISKVSVGKKLSGGEIISKN